MEEKEKKPKTQNELFVENMLKSSEQKKDVNPDHSMHNVDKGVVEGEFKNIMNKLQQKKK